MTGGMVDPNELLRLPSTTSAGGRRWLAQELAAGLIARVGLRPIGPPVMMLRELILRAWAQGRSPTLDELLTAALEGEGPQEPPVHARLELALRFVIAAPEFAGGAAEPEFRRRATAARAAAASA